MPTKWSGEWGVGSGWGWGGERLAFKAVQLDEMGGIFRQKGWTGQAKQRTRHQKGYFPLLLLNAPM